MNQPTPRQDGYLPIAAYGLIGDCRSAALVGNDGSIDWCCLPRFDSPSVFGRILDAKKGGYWQLTPQGPFTSVQRYRDRTNILGTVFQTPTGRVMVTDFMPVEEETMQHHARPHGHPRLIRLVECLAGEVTMINEVDLQPDYARCEGQFKHDGDTIHITECGMHFCVKSSQPFDGPRTEYRLGATESMAFGMWCTPRRCISASWTVEKARNLYAKTREYWWRWISGCEYDGPYTDPVYASALALKLMTYSPTGAIIAAPTTSLPERIGGPRNWDYRFTWLRDASFTLYAFFQLGLHDEAHDFYHWLSHTGIGDHGSNRVPNLFTLDGGSDIQETELTHLSGYMNSSPVRVGNGAVNQLQLDIYGELIDSAYLYSKFGGEVSRGLWRELSRVVDLATEQWQLPDASIWETRRGDDHFTYSKVMCWVAVDRGLRLAQRFKLPHDRSRWMSARRAIHQRITRDGFNRHRNSFVQTLGGNDVDAALLRLSQVRFLADKDPRIIATVRAVQRRLSTDVLVNRYRLKEWTEDFRRFEGAFLMCSFWMVDALAHIGELHEAERRFERLLSFGSTTELFGEEVNVQTGEQLGNYPQAFTHLALVGAAVNIERARNRKLSAKGLKRR